MRTRFGRPGMLRAVMLLSVLVVGARIGRSPLAMEAAPTGSPATIRESPQDAAAAFNLLKTLAGEWRGRSTKGWDDRGSIQMIAKGSVFLQTSEFEAHPGETMLTTISADGGRLLLTHFCIAGNQPRMEAAGIQQDGRTILFTFIDGGNLPSRDKGHMDKALYRLIDKDHFTSQWTWYEGGSERWMEEIVFERTK